MDAEARKPYVEQSQEDKLRYQREIAALDPSEVPAATGKAPKDPNAPKKPRTAYWFFGEATRIELEEGNPGVRIDTLGSLIHDEWDKLSEEAKAPYVQKAEEDKQRYEDEMDVYDPSRKKPKKASSKGAASSSAADGDANEDVDGDDDDGADAAGPSKGGGMVQENKALKKKLAALEKQTAKQQKQIDQLIASMSASKEKEASDGTAKVKPPAKAAPAEEAKQEAPPAYPTEPERYYSWCKKVLGPKGEKADEEMLKVYASKGAKGLGKFLVKQFKAEHK